ncbi:glycosyltransferase [Pedobacter sp. AW31-3R]|uniref:glycosyltransferase n=1 Tax=Pedobacter sp. AW31-3R TaxID=3445781 RepID=UPI003FA12DAD
MKILFVNTLYAPFQVGGAEVSVRTMAEGLVTTGHQVYVLTLGYEQSVRRLNGVVVISLKTKNLYHIEKSAGQHPIKKLIWHLLDSGNPFYKKVLGRLLDKIKPDVVNTNNIQGFSPSIWKTIKSRNIKLVHTMRDYYLMCHTTTMYTKCGDCQQLCTACKLTWSIKKKYFLLPDGFIGISRFILDQHSRFNIGHQKPQQVIANGLDNRNYPVPRIKNPHDEVVLGFIGKVNRQKGVDFMLGEIAKIDTHTRFRVVIAGKADPDFINEMTALYEGKFEFSFIGKTDAQAFYRSVDLILVPSNWNEPFGRIPIEAIATATPVCLADKAGLAELYDERYMWKFEMVENSLKALLEEILAHPQVIAAKSAAAAEAEHKYAPALLNEQLSSFLLEV